LFELPDDSDAMLLSEFAGLVVCPELIPPSEWLPVVWGGEKAPDFEDVKEAKTTLDAIMPLDRRWQRRPSIPDDPMEWASKSRIVRCRHPRNRRYAEECMDRLRNAIEIFARYRMSLICIRPT
jgi:hypothetical protein